jgi:hypothetical protein
VRLKPRHEPQLNFPANYCRVNFSPRHILQATQHIIQNDPLMTSDCGDGFAPVGSTKFRLVVSYPSSSAMEGLSFQPFFFSSEHYQDLLPCSLHIESNLLVSCSLSHSLIFIAHTNIRKHHYQNPWQCPIFRLPEHPRLPQLQLMVSTLSRTEM